MALAATGEKFEAFYPEVPSLGIFFMQTLDQTQIVLSFSSHCQDGVVGWQACSLWEGVHDESDGELWIQDQQEDHH